MVTADINRLIGITIIILTILVVLPYERFNVSKKGILVIKIIYVVVMLSISVWFFMQTF